MFYVVQLRLYAPRIRQCNQIFFLSFLDTLLLKWGIFIHFYQLEQYIPHKGMLLCILNIFKKNIFNSSSGKQNFAEDLFYIWNVFNILLTTIQV